MFLPETVDELFAWEGVGEYADVETVRHSVGLDANLGTAELFVYIVCKG